ncbi:MAG: ABC transporter permease, partial [Flavobacteriaceae bacterium]
MQKQGLSSLALQKFKKSFWGVFSFWFIVFMAFISVFAYILAPDSSQHANQMHLSI